MVETTFISLSILIVLGLIIIKTINRKNNKKVKDFTTPVKWVDGDSGVKVFKLKK